MLWFTALLALCFAPVLYHMGFEWLHNDDMGHGVFVPIVVLWIVWTRKEELLRLPLRPSRWGLAVILASALLLVAGTLGVELFVSRIAFLVSLCGVLLYFGGAPLIRFLGFPLFLLLFMVRIPAIIYNQITFPLQLFASSIAEQTLWSMGIPVLREGNLLHLASQTLSVVEACSGIRSLLSLTFLSLVYAYFFDSRVWMRPVLLVAAVPIAVLTNAFRVTLTGVLSEYDQELAEGVFHAIEGWVIFLIAFLLLIATHRAISRIYRLFRPSSAAGVIR